MKNDYELLNRIHKNMQMGISTLPILIEKTKNNAFRNVITDQLAEYRNINSKAESMMKEQGMTRKDVNPMLILNATSMTNVMTAMNSSTSKLAEMAIKGSNTGITKLTKALHHNKPIGAEVKSLADQVLKTEEKNLKALREYL